MGNGKCVNCFAPLAGGSVCGQCGFDNAAYRPQPHHLPPGTVLRDRYIIGRAMGQGGFGITYVGFDTNLDFKVAIKEYFPEGTALRDASQTAVSCYPSQNTRERYDVGLRKCVNEARALAKLGAIPSIVRVQDFFQENNTVYIIMEFVEGVTLNAYLKRLPERPGYKEAVTLLAPVGAALEEIHASGFVHRDISPDNIMITRKGEPKLLDFGAVKAVATGGSVTENPVVKRGFSPMEMYTTDGKIGPWTDMYAYCATLCYILLGRPPEEPMDRVEEDPLPGILAKVVSPEQAAALLKGLAFQTKRRYQSMVELLAALNACKDDTAPVQDPAKTVLIDSRGTEKPADPERTLLSETEVIAKPAPKKPEPAAMPETEVIESSAPKKTGVDKALETNVRTGDGTVLLPTGGKKKKPIIIAAAITALVALCVIIGIAVSRPTGKVSVASPTTDASATTQAPSTTKAPSTTSAPSTAKAPTTTQPQAEETDKVTIKPINSAGVGDYVEFGMYEQDNNTSNGKEDIEWLVLAKEDGKAFLISRYGLACKKYNETDTSVTWETCTLRTWLNGTFYNSAFSGAEQESIVSTTVTASVNPVYDTNPDNDTNDKVFLLSIDEANQYISLERDRMCIPTAYAATQGAYESSDYKVGGKGCCWWWLRSRGDLSYTAATVSYGGNIRSVGYNVNSANGAVRPALWVDLNA